METKERMNKQKERHKERNDCVLKESQKGFSFVQECSFSFYKPRSSEYRLLSRDCVCVCMCACQGDILKHTSVEQLQ